MSCRKVDHDQQDKRIASLFGVEVIRLNEEMCRQTFHIDSHIIKSRAIILTRVQSKAYTEPSSFSSLFSKDIHYFSQARHIAHPTTQCRKYFIYYKVYVGIYFMYGINRLLKVMGNRIIHLNLYVYISFACHL